MSFKRSINFLAAIVAVAVVVSPALAAYTFFAGRNWNAVTSSSYSPQAVNAMKLYMLKAAQDASVFTGKPILPQNEMNLSAYIPIIDDIYKLEYNVDLPLFFAIKLADMKRQRMPDAQLKIYSASIMKKIKR